MDIAINVSLIAVYFVDSMLILLFQIQNFRQTCRICLFQGVILYHINSQDVRNLFENLAITLDNHLELPQNVCIECLEQLKKANEIKMKCEGSQIFLMDLLGKSQNFVFIKTEDIDVIDQKSSVSEDFNNAYDSPCDSPCDSRFEVLETVQQVVQTKKKMRSKKLKVKRINKQQKQFICEGCGEFFQRASLFINHFKKIHKKPDISMYRCHLCKQTFR